MRVRSMTGFGSWDGTHEGIRLRWELRSVNGRGLDLKLRMPTGFEAAESDLKREAAAFLRRGNVQATLTIVGDGEPNGLSINRSLLADLVAAAAELVRDDHAAPPTADGLLSLRGVIEPRDTSGAGVRKAELVAAAVSGFRAALGALSVARIGEGAALAIVLSSQLTEIETLVANAAADPARRPEAIVERLRRQVNAIRETGTILDEGRLAQEAALLATRADIGEELDRLRVHLASARELLSADDAVGRRLDFLAQEFHRESNTICSKSNAASLTAIGLELKIVVDQFREQVQNIE